MAIDPGLRDGRLNCPEDKNGLTRGTHIELDSHRSSRVPNHVHRLVGEVSCGPSPYPPLPISAAPWALSFTTKRGRSSQTVVNSGRKFFVANL
jgi:hypothetical protein